MRILFVSLLVAAPAFPQLLSVGVKGGAPFTDAFNTARTGSLNYLSDTKRYTVGPTVEFHLPLGFGIEADALYKRIDYTLNAMTASGLAASSSLTTANTWEFPVLVKHRFVPGPISPYLGAGASFRHVSSVKQVTNFFTGGQMAVSTDRPGELSNRFTAGFVVSGGIQFGSGHFRVAPELRYTRWGWENFRSPGGLLTSKPDEAEFLVGVTF